MSEDLVMKLYHEYYTNLQIEASDEIIKSFDEVLKKHPNATFIQLIASMKLYLVGVITMMVNKQQEQQAQGDGNESKTE
jgi:hypothetical protein